MHVIFPEQLKHLPSKTITVGIQIYILIMCQSQCLYQVNDCNSINRSKQVRYKNDTSVC